MKKMAKAKPAKKKPPKKAAATDSTGRASSYQVSKSLPDLRNAKPRTKTAPKSIPAKHPWKKFFKRAFLVLLIVFVVITGWLGYKALRDSNKLGTNLWSLFDNSKLRGEDRGRINILLAGDSSDDPGHQGADLTDSIMLISIDPKNKTAFLMSIPRDLYVNIPGHGYSKINAAYEYGEAQHFSQSGYPSGGMGLLEKTVSEKFAIPIDYYALINYTAFRDSVNAVGGVTVNVNSFNKYGVYDPYAGLKLSNGTQQLNGQQALALSRARGDGPGSYGVTSDFDRTGYQRQILLALKDKATSAGVLANPVKIGNLFDAAGNNVKTDLSLGNIRRLVKLTQPIGNSAITSVSLNDVNKVNYLKSYTTSDGQSALIPAAGLNNYSQIQAYLQKLTAPPATAN